MKHPTSGVSSFTRECELSSILVEFGPPLDEFEYPPRPLFHEDSHRLFITQPGTCLDCILKVDADLVLVTQGNGDTALGIFGGAFGWYIFCHYHDAPVARKLYRCPETSNTAADNQEIGVYTLYHFSPILLLFLSVYHRIRAISLGDMIGSRSVMLEKRSAGEAVLGGGSFAGISKCMIPPCRGIYRDNKGFNSKCDILKVA